MKKRIGAMFGLAILCLFLTSCSEKANPSNDVKYNYPVCNVGNLKIGGLFFDSNILYASQNGCLTLLDPVSEKKAVYCFDIECDHGLNSAKSTPTGCFAVKHINSYAILGDEHLVFTEPEGTINSKLVKSDIDTRNQKPIASFDGEIESVFYYHDNAIVICDSLYKEEGEILVKKELTDRKVYLTDLDDDDTKIIYSDSKIYSQLQSISCFDDIMLMLCVELDISEDIYLQNIESFEGDLQKVQDYNDVHCRYVVYSISLLEDKVEEKNFYTGCRSMPYLCGKYLFMEFSEDNNNYMKVIDIVDGTEKRLDIKESMIASCNGEKIVAVDNENSSSEIIVYNYEDLSEERRTKLGNKTIADLSVVNNKVFFIDLAASTNSYLVTDIDSFISGELASATLMD